MHTAQNDTKSVQNNTVMYMCDFWALSGTENGEHTPQTGVKQRQTASAEGGKPKRGVDITLWAGLEEQLI